MKIGITGGHGFIGWHLRCYLKTLVDVDEVRIADRATFAELERMIQFVDGLDLIVHLAGVNRAPEQVQLEENIGLARALVNALASVESPPSVLYASSTQAVEPLTAYGRGKAIAGERLAEWAQRRGGRFIDLVIPHVFGEYGRPNYNSAVATFCHQVATGQAPSVTGDGILTLVHVQDLVERMIGLYLAGAAGTHVIEGRPVRVTEVAAQLQAMHEQYLHRGVLPNLVDPFDRALFNALRGALPADQRLFPAVLHTDARGWLVETVKAGSGGQCFVSATVPGVTRGNHFHRRKVERFFVLQGRARIRLRRLFTNEVLTYDLDGTRPACVDMPTLHTHSISNTGDGELLTLFWSDEVFDPANPDTYPEPVGDD